MKLYLRINPKAENAKVASKYVVEYQNALEWGDVKDATLDYKEAADATREKLKGQLGMESSVEEISPDKWAVYKEK